MNQIDKNFLKVLLSVPEPTLKFNEIKIDKDKEYQILILDYLKPLKSEIARHDEEYMVYRSLLKKGFDDLYLDLGLIYKVNFPIKAFTYALERAPNYKTLLMNKQYECLLTFKRTTHKNITITKREWSEVVFDAVM